ncbi:ABC transporter permease [Amycolatopsis sp. MtRt-6]|uniref:ABC transporter permease n=1 Tax=Amycolatopsis sp. MtRt-6 TaxID=2792782 RepID=UPI001F5C5939|nr:ABC transporter permease [Amycolatopsis sp. MtRt-6]
MPEPPEPVRLGPRELLGLGTVGLRTRPMRTALAALGIAIGIAALIAVVGIPASNQAALRTELEALGPNLLTVAPGRDVAAGTDAKLPASAPAMIRRIPPVQSVSATGTTSATVRRTDHVPADRTGGIRVSAAKLDLLPVLHGTVRTGTFLTSSTAELPVTVLGARAAELLAAEPGRLVWIKDRWFSVAGVLDALPLAPEIDNSVLVGWPVAERLLGFDGSPGFIYLRADSPAVDTVKSVLGRTVNPLHPNQVLVSRPSEVLTAQRFVERAYSALFLGLGAIALLVGGIGVANTMVISVLERRREIGLRRALGATRGHIGGQFLAESVLLAGLGGALGLLVGVAVTAGYSAAQGWPTVLPPAVLAGGAGAAAAVGVLAGVYPAVRATRLTPTEALAST